MILTDSYLWNAFTGRWIRNDQLCPTLQQQLHEQQTKEAMTKFKKGDRVKVSYRHSKYYGSEGVVIRHICGEVYDVNLTDGDNGAAIAALDESVLTLVDQPLSTTPDKVLQAAKTSPQAKDALKALFPDVFKDEPLMSRLGGGSRIFDGVFIGSDGSYVLAGEGVEVRVKEHAYGTTTITFHKKP